MEELAKVVVLAASVTVVVIVMAIASIAFLAGLYFGG